MDKYANLQTLQTLNRKGDRYQVPLNKRSQYHQWNGLSKQKQREEKVKPQFDQTSADLKNYWQRTTVFRSATSRTYETSQNIRCVCFLTTKKDKEKEIMIVSWGRYDV